MLDSGFQKLSLLLVLVLVLASAHGARANVIKFDQPQCLNGSLYMETSEGFPAVGCHQPISSFESYEARTPTSDAPSPLWRNFRYAHFDAYSDANCANKIQWTRLALSDQKERFTAWGWGFFRCELRNGVESYFVQSRDTGDINNQYETKKCLLDQYAGNRYYFVTCVRSSATTIVNTVGETFPHNSTSGASPSSGFGNYWWRVFFLLRVADLLL